MLARVRASQRRSLSETSEPVFQRGSLVVDFAARQVHLDGIEIMLTPTEYSLLRVLVQNAGKVVTHRQLLRTVWGEKAESQAQYLRVYVTHLRKKLEAKKNAPSVIKTEVGIGYRLATELAAELVERIAVEPAGEGTSLTFSLRAELSGLKRLLMGGAVQSTMDAEMSALDALKTQREGA